MSTALVSPPVTGSDAPARRPRAGKSAGPVTFPRAVRSEWVKFRTLRSSWLMLLSSFLAMVGIAVAVGYNTGKNWAGLPAEDSAPSGGLQGYLLAQLVIGVLGVLFVTGEYGTGMIRSTLGAVPGRVPVLAGKAVVFGGVALLVMVPASLAAFGTAQLFLSHYGHGTALTAPGVLRVVLGTGVYLVLLGLLGSALGWMVRSTAGGISAFVGLVLILPLLTGLLPGSLPTTLAHYLPSNAGESFIQSVHVPGALGPWTGLAVLIGWVVAALAVAGVLLRRRDA
jgi:ABC-2 type transport system permease protein